LEPKYEGEAVKMVRVRSENVQVRILLRKVHESEREKGRFPSAVPSAFLLMARHGGVS